MSTFKANALLLKNLLDDVANGKIQLPDFQRGWVWDDDRIKDLLISISRGFPIGAVMTLDAGGDLRFRSRPVEGVASNAAGQAAEYLLDGQQRLTSLYQALRYEGPVETRYRPGGRWVIKRWYYIDIQKVLNPLVNLDDTIVSVPEDRVVRSNFGRDIALDLSSPEREFEHHMIPTEQVMDGMDWMLGYIEYWQGRGSHPHDSPSKFFRQFKDAVLENFTAYQLPVISLGKGTSKEAVCTVFEKVNTGGVTLNVFELVTAAFAADDFSLRDDWAARSGRLHSEFGVLQGVSGDQFLQAVTLLATQERRRRASSGPSPGQLPGIGCRRADILNLTFSEYQTWADRVEEGFIDAAKFLRSQFVFTRYNVPYNTQLVPLAALYVELGNELVPANAQEKLSRWFWCGIFSESYGSGVETQFARDLEQVANHIRDGAEPALVVEASFIPERLLSLRTRNSSAYKGLYALQMKSGAADWRNAKSLAFATIHDENIDIHHIFPVAWSRQTKPEVPRYLYDSVINKTPIDALTNRIIGGHAPSRYLPRLRQDINEERLNGILTSHWINPGLLEKDLFGDCFVDRGQAMLDLINRTMGKPSVDGRQVFRDALDSAGLAEEYDDEIEYDPFGDSAYADETLGSDTS
ncbi:MAG: DUF262 domain-containing protein [Chloroflexota bacterium]|nr:DUF262 domain-containing protein [Chloroflexota bacterium]